MNAVLQEKPRPAPRNNNPQNESTTNRLTRMETRWETVIPNLATKEGLADLRGEVKEIKTLQESQMRMMQELKSTHERIFTALDAVHEIQGKFSSDLRLLDAKIDAQTNKIIVRMGGVTLAIVTLACTAIGLIMKFT